MYESKHLQAVLYFVLIVIVLEGDTRRPRLREEKPGERRDYRPSKWVANSAMDVWYGNKSMVDIVFREFSDVMNRIAIRPVRSPLPGSIEIHKGTKDVIKDSLKVSSKPVVMENLKEGVSKATTTKC